MYTLHCFGRLALENGDGESLRLRSRKHLAILLYLAARSGLTHSRSKLSRLLWSTAPSLARHSLSQALYDIRSTLPGVRIHGSADRVTMEKRGVRLDAEEFERAIQAGDVGRAVELYEGDFAPHLETIGTRRFEEWVEAERLRFGRLAEIALARHLRACDDSARWGELCVVAYRLVDMNPLNEEAHRAFMRALWLQGDQEAALRHFRDVGDFLERELPEGISEETRDLLVRIRSSRPGRTVAAEESGEEPPMVGRGAEFEALRKNLGRARRGMGRLVVVRGEAGMGKTRLLRQFSHVAPLEGVQVLESRCYSAESEVAYGPIIDGLGDIVEQVTQGHGSPGPEYQHLPQLFPDLFPGKTEVDERTDPAAGRRRLFEETADVLRRACASEPVVWFLEDIHWIDVSSAALLHYLHRRLGKHPFLLVTTLRTCEEPSEAAEKLLAASSGSPPPVVIDLAPLSAKEISKLVQAARKEASENAEALVGKLAGGNPFFALEILRALGDSSEHALESEFSKRLITERLRALLQVRLKGLRPGATRILEIVAVLERHAEPRLVARLAGLPIQRVAELAETLYSRLVLRDAGPVLEFSHDITREFVYANMGDLPRAALHLAVAELLSADHAEVNAGTLARHFRLGGDRARAYEHAIRAAEIYREHFAHDEAVNFARAALAHSRRPAERVRSLKVLSKAEMASGRLDGAREHLAQLLAQSQELSPEEHIRLRLELVHAMVESAEWEQALAELDNLTEDLQTVDGEGQLKIENVIETLILRLKVAMRQREDEAARDAVTKIRELLKSNGSSNLTARGKLSGIVHVAHYKTLYEGVPAASEYLKKGDALLDEVDSDLKLRNLLLKGIIAGRRALWDQCEHYLHRAQAIARKMNDVMLRHILLNNRMCFSVERGRWIEVKALINQIDDLSRGMPETTYVTIFGVLNQAEYQFYTGNPAGAQEILKVGAERAAALGAESAKPEVHALRGLILLQHGNIAAAEDCRAEISGLTRNSLRMVQNQYRIVWLQAFLSWLEGDEDAAAKLRAGAERERDRDRVSHLKMKCLAELLARADGRRPEALLLSDIPPELKRELRDDDLYWFLPFAKRWYRRTLSTIFGERPQGSGRSTAREGPAYTASFRS